MKRTLLTLVAMTLAASLSHAQAAAPDAEKPRPVGKITGGDALVKEKGKFAETWLHPDAALHHYSEIYLWNVSFQFRDVGTKPKSQGTESTVLRSTGRDAYPIDEESREKFKKVVMDAFVHELQRSKKFKMVDAVGPGTLVVRGALLDVVSWVPPSAGRADHYLAVIGEGTVAFELIDPETGLMQARVGERSNIALPKGSHETFSKPANLNALWPDIDRWARARGSDLRKELEKRLEKKD